MENILHKELVLSLNKSWQPIGILTVKKALVNIFSSSDDENSAVPLDVEMATDENGNQVLVHSMPVTIEEWLKLPVRPGDLWVQSAHQQVRVPTIIVSSKFNKMPLRRKRLSRSGIAERDAYVCQYSGEFTGKNGGNLDHVIPRDRGGKDSWGNLVWSKKEINSRKGNKLNHEAGLSLLRQPQEPKALPMSATITKANHPTWEYFLIK